MTAFALGLLGLVLSLAVPAPLARSRWTLATPAASVVLWQAVVLASVLSAVAVVLIAPEEISGALRAGPTATAWGLVGALAVALLIVARLATSLVGVMRRSAARRERHRELLDLLDDAERSAALAGDLAAASEDDDDRARPARPTRGAAHPDPSELRVLGAPLPLAYGLPGRSPRVVVSDGALRLLDTAQLRAVLAHEQAHLDARHDVVLESFAAFHRAVPRPLRNERALGAVELLLEAAADDAARRRCGNAPLRSALELLGAAVDPGVGALAAAGTEAERTADDRAVAAQRAQRLDRLRRPLPRRWRSAGVLALAAGVLVLPPVVLIAPWLADALATLPPP
ncbi:Peptidase family M48 [Quadrisphaera granulorum]|uniref:Peptidase M48-like protein n=1 Tax=Quadrisphaera granulorum TaxID=317664 RepID=A0A316AVH4_9ACTN|nr:M48 family metalloprotease [Quadrisphaera granulorum]PWJ54097.1 peptidase M48-like protein [Quadrisphaera granulorum]SZE96236.1 Peptidase family M48 [Quadrisphaera granulorum]